MSDTRWQRLRRHGAFHAAVIFASAVWLGLQAADVFGVPMSFVRVFGLGFIVVFAGLAGYAWLDTRQGEADSDKSPGMVRRRWQAVVAAAITLLVLSGGTWWLRPQLFSAVTPGADVIAVLPFRTSGPSVGLLGEGLVDLLSANLNEVGRVRTIDPRTTLHHWKQLAVNGTVDRNGALEVGRAVGAGSVLLGSVVEAGGTARLSAELVSIEGGTLASASRDGAADSVFELVDRLSVDVLHDVWRAREPLPELRLSAITTSSPRALRAYMQGEQHYRRAEWDSARISFERAIDEDSTFALAYFRVAESYGWTEGIGSAAARRHASAAARFADRLPAPERSLVSGYMLHEQGRLNAIDTLRAYVARYPDDATGWYLLADAQYHAFPLLNGVTLDELYRPFDRALELDPTFIPAMLHPLERSVMLGDSARFNRYIGGIDSTEIDSPTAFWRTAGELRWSPSDRRLAALAEALRNNAKSSSDTTKLLRTHAAAVLDDSIPRFEEIHAGFDTARATLPSDSPLGWYSMEAQAAASMGEFRAAQAILDTLRTVNRDLVLGAVIPVVLSGRRPPDYGVDGLKQLMEQRPEGPSALTVRYWQTLIALSEGDTLQARRILHDAAQTADTTFGPILTALRSLTRLGTGDTLAGIEQLQADLQRVGYGSDGGGSMIPIRIQLAVIESTRPDRSKEAIRILGWLAASEPVYALLFAPPLADAYERAGMTAEAARTWVRYIAVLEQGDSEVQPFVESARRTLEKLVAERGPA